MLPGMFADQTINVVLAADPAVLSTPEDRPWDYAESAQVAEGATPTVFAVRPLNSWQKLELHRQTTVTTVATVGEDGEDGADLRVDVPTAAISALIRSNLASIDGDAKAAERFAASPGEGYGVDVFRAIMEVGDLPTTGPV